jgi:hypothetical protein
LADGLDDLPHGRPLLWGQIAGELLHQGDPDIERTDLRSDSHECFRALARNLADSLSHRASDALAEALNFELELRPSRNQRTSVGEHSFALGTLSRIARNIAMSV